MDVGTDNVIYLAQAVLGHGTADEVHPSACYRREMPCQRHLRGGRLSQDRSREGRDRWQTVRVMTRAVSRRVADGVLYVDDPTKRAGETTGAASTRIGVYHQQREKRGSAWHRIRARPQREVLVRSTLVSELLSRRRNNNH